MIIFAPRQTLDREVQVVCPRYQRFIKNQLLQFFHKLAFQCITSHGDQFVDRTIKSFSYNLNLTGGGRKSRESKMRREYYRVRIEMTDCTEQVYIYEKVSLRIELFRLARHSKPHFIACFHSQHQPGIRTYLILCERSISGFIDPWGTNSTKNQPPQSAVDVLDRWMY